MFKNPILPFILTGLPRTGSTLLLYGLDQHPQVTAYRELMHWSDQERQGHHAIQRDGNSVSYAADEDAVAFLRREVFDREHSGNRAAGFKLFSEYKQCEGTLGLHGRLSAEIPNLHVIHIVRSNHFDTLVSWKVAYATDVWRRPAGTAEERPKVPRLTIDPDGAAAEFERMDQTNQRLASVYGSCPYIRVEYDQLVADFHGQMARTYNFLGVPEIDVAPALEKQIKVPAREIVENYEELVDAFSGTQFERFFVP